MVGNVMIDTLLDEPREGPQRLDDARAPRARRRASTAPDPAPPEQRGRPRRLLTALFEALEEIHREVPILFPVHPRTVAALRDRTAATAASRPRLLRMVEPLGYLDFLRLMADAKLVLTDSGGIQEETTALGTSMPYTAREHGAARSR